MDNIQNIGIGETLKSFQLETDVAVKLQKSFGLKVAQKIANNIYGVNTYIFLRNNRFRFNRNLANGRVDIKQMFGDRLNFDGKVNFSNLSWKAPAIINTTIGGMVGRWMARNEKATVTAVDLKSKNQKKEEEDKAVFYHEHKDKLNELTNASGYEMIPKDQFVAEDKDELDEWVTEFNRIPEEIKYEIGINTILRANGLFDVIKDKILHDSCEVGLVATHTYMDRNGEIHIDWIQPENIFYSYSKFPDFRDTTWRGHISTLKVSELRAMYGKEFGGDLDEETIYKIACTAKEYQLYDKLQWLQEWNVSFLRPYDEWNVDIANFELRSLDSDSYTFTKTKNNNSTLIDKGVPKKVKDNQKVVKEQKWNIYKGVYHNATQTMLEWGIKDNMIRPNDPKEMGNAEFSYSFYMYQNYDMRNLAIPEKIEEPVEQMILARLKIQQLVAKMKPAGAAINLDALQELDLGLGDYAKPLEVQRLWEQTGNLYYRGKDNEGNPIPVPINEISNSGFAPQLQALIQLYQFHFSVLKDELGEDPNLASAATRPRVTEGNVQVAQAVGDAKTDYMYDAYLCVMKETAKKVACLLHNSVTYGAKKYRELVKEDEIKDRDFSTDIEMLPTEQEIAQLQQQMYAAVASNPNFATYLDTFKIMRMAKEDIKLAELYYRRSMKRMLKSEQQIAQQNAQQNAQVQQQSIAAKQQGDMELMKQELELKSQIIELESKAKQKELIISGIFSVYSKGLQMPQEFKNVEAGMLNILGMDLTVEQMQQQQHIAQGQAEQQQAMQEQAAQQGGQQEQQNPQEEQMEQQQGTQEPMPQEMAEQQQIQPQ